MWVCNSAITVMSESAVKGVTEKKTQLRSLLSTPKPPTTKTTTTTTTTSTNEISVWHCPFLEADEPNDAAHGLKSCQLCMPCESVAFEYQKKTRIKNSFFKPKNASNESFYRFVGNI